MNLISWFEIHVNDFDRAKTFYEKLLGVSIEVREILGFRMGTFPQGEGVSGAIIQGKNCVPSPEGVLVYLNGDPDMNVLLGKVTAAGGKVVVPRTTIGGGSGSFAVFTDSEGNRLGIYSNT
jgi:predicted enzyme related to lactoylglutathione lyase